MSTFPDEKCKTNKRMTFQQFYLRAHVRFVVRKIESRIVAEKFSDEGECFA